MGDDVIRCGDCGSAEHAGCLTISEVEMVSEEDVEKLRSGLAGWRRAILEALLEERESLIAERADLSDALEDAEHQICDLVDTINIRRGVDHGYKA